MRRREPQQQIEPQYPLHQEAFAFLEQCSRSRFDFTSAEAPNPSNSKISPPSKILALMREVDFQDLMEVRGESRGEQQTLQECVNFFNRRGIRCDGGSVSLSDGILSALDHVYTALGLNADKKILVLTPTFGYYFKQFRVRNIGFETLATKAENNFLPNLKELEEKIVRTGVKALLLCYPNNPTGAVMTEEYARAIADIAKRHEVFIISDEAFMNNSLTQKKHFPIAAIGGDILEHSITITSASKSMFIGVKTGFCVGRRDLIQSFEKLGGYPTRHSQKIVAASLEDSDENREYLEKCRDYYLQNIHLIEEKISKLNQKFSQQFSEEKIYVKPLIANPDAANVYMLDFSGLRGKIHNGKPLSTGLDISRFLLEEASVGTVPGECFLFEQDKMLVRVTLNNSAQEMAQAFDSISLATEKIQNAPARSLSRSNGEAFSATVATLTTQPASKQR